MVTKRPYLEDEDGNTLGEIWEYDDRRPTEKSAKEHIWRPPAGARRAVRIEVDCKGAVLLSACGREPARLFGLYVGGEFRFDGSRVIAPRPDVVLAARRSGVIGDRPDYVGPVIADEDHPLPVWCPYHKRGHDIDPSRLRAAIRDADQVSRRRGKGRPHCPVGRVECRGDADVGV